APSSVYTRRNSYHPKYGTAPERGRHEIDPGPDRRLPEQAESYSRSWGTQSDVSKPARDTYGEPQRYPSEPPKPYSSNDPADVPATIDDGNRFNPPIIVAPRIRP